MARIRLDGAQLTPTVSEAREARRLIEVMKADEGHN